MYEESVTKIVFRIDIFLSVSSEYSFEMLSVKSSGPLLSFSSFIEMGCFEQNAKPIVERYLLNSVSFFRISTLLYCLDWRVTSKCNFLFLFGVSFKRIKNLETLNYGMTTI